MHAFTKFLYGLSGLLFLSAGTSLVLYKTDLLPAAIEEMILNTAENRDRSLHLLQEFGALMVFAGLLSFWYIKDYVHSGKFHAAMIVYWALMSVIHWTDALSSGNSLLFPAINSVPLLLFTVTGVMRIRK